jgi:hypothetical protein
MEVAGSFTRIRGQQNTLEVRFHANYGQQNTLEVQFYT